MNKATKENKAKALANGYYIRKVRNREKYRLFEIGKGYWIAFLYTGGQGIENAWEQAANYNSQPEVEK